MTAGVAADDATSGAATPWILDISRLLDAAAHGRLGGMERVELAYARHVLGLPGGVFTGLSPWGWFAALPKARVAALLAAFEGNPTAGRDMAPGAPRDASAPAARDVPPPAARDVAPPAARDMARRLRLHLALGQGRAALARTASRPGAVFSIVAHQGLHRARAIQAIKRHGALFLPEVQDLIPLEWPHTTRWMQRLIHRARMLAVGRLADGVLVSSASVAASLEAWLARHGMAMPPCRVVPLGLDLRAAPMPLPEPGAPYFLCIATIEIRKNHALLLDVWQALHAQRGMAAPRLVLVGRRSFGAAAILARLDDRLPFAALIEERGHCTDAELAGLLAGARALLLPTLAEGFGLPVAEALANGVPVLCSDLPVLREVGDAAPDYLPVTDAAAWQAAILAYAVPESPARTAQLARIGAWRAPDWPGHFAAVTGFMAALSKPVLKP